MNKYKNEIEIDLGEGTYLLRATYSFIAEIETYFNKSLTEILQTIAQTEIPSNLKIAETIKIFQEGIKAADGKVPDEEELGELIINYGPGKAAGQAATFLLYAYNGGPAFEKLAENLKKKEVKEKS